MGNIRCSKCHRGKDSDVNPCACGHDTCYISLYWMGRQHRFFRYHVDGEPFDKRRALKQLAEMNLAIENRSFNPALWTTQGIKERKFSQQAVRWLDVKRDEVRAGELSPETLKNYSGYVNNYLTPFFKRDSFEWDVQEIGFEQLEGFKDYLRGLVKGIKTRRNILNALHAMFTWMYRKGIVKAMPPWPVIEGDNSRSRLAVDYDAQVKALKRIPGEHRDVIEFGFETGLRPGETTALKVGDIDIINRQALIQRTWAGAKLRETTKGKNKRWIPLSETAHELVKRNIKGKLPDAWVFVNPETNRRYTAKRLNQIWREHSGLDCDHYSASRHSFCTQIVETGVNVFQAQELMRHADIRSTQKYFHGSAKRLREAVNRRGKVIELNLNEQKAKEIR